MQKKYWSKVKVYNRPFINVLSVSSWPIRWYKYILQKVHCLLGAHAPYRQTDRQTDGNATSIVECLLRRPNTH